MKKNNRLALGGVMTALGIVLMLLTGVIPMMDFALPAAAGVLLIPVVVEAGYKYAWICFGATAFLSFMVAPSKECAMYYIGLLGFYPIVKSLVEQKGRLLWEALVKLLVFNVCLAGMAISALFLFRFPGYDELLQEAWWMIAAGIVGLNFIFGIYDVALTSLITGYMKWFRPKYIQKLFK